MNPTVGAIGRLTSPSGADLIPSIMRSPPNELEVATGRSRDTRTYMLRPSHPVMILWLLYLVLRLQQRGAARSRQARLAFLLPTFTVLLYMTVATDRLVLLAASRSQNARSSNVTSIRQFAGSSRSSKSRSSSSSYSSCGVFDLFSPARAMISLWILIYFPQYAL